MCSPFGLRPSHLKRLGRRYLFLLQRQERVGTESQASRAPAQGLHPPDPDCSLPPRSFAVSNLMLCRPDSPCSLSGSPYRKCSCFGCVLLPNKPPKLRQQLSWWFHGLAQRLFGWARPCIHHHLAGGLGALCLGWPGSLVWQGWAGSPHSLTSSRLDCACPWEHPGLAASKREQAPVPRASHPSSWHICVCHSSQIKSHGQCRSKAQRTRFPLNEKSGHSTEQEMSV
jgi:hypothetical protein